MSRQQDESIGHRHDRLEHLVLEELQAIFDDEVADPVLESVLVRAVSLSVDYRNARVHYVLRADGMPRFENDPQVERALLRVAPFLRRRLGESVELKRLPELRFVFDGAAVNLDGGAP